jgi:membrane protein implicated in regulation of membrane protease activity
MRILRTALIALGGLFVVVLGARAAEMVMLDNHHIFLSQIIFVAVAALFVAGCAWRLFHVDDQQSRHEH